MSQNSPKCIPDRCVHKQEVLVSSQEVLVVMGCKYLKSDWCKTQPLRQTVSQEDCRSRTVINCFCYGQCNFFFIPRHVKKEQESFQSCAFCRPNRFTSLTVELDCYRKIQSVKQCHCMSVSVSKSGNSERTMRRHLLLI
ncbi:gremlin-2-like [Megalobrama amblycephala]|uniref:gremlin-2-like n=1 Tax=Megalobrama amblycephala TaxID=75352 RepID=UPI0020142D4E|nr:gremlin-2-like [Megalobrama amblycephala]